MLTAFSIPPFHFSFYLLVLGDSPSFLLVHFRCLKTARGHPDARAQSSGGREERGIHPWEHWWPGILVITCSRLSAYSPVYSLLAAHVSSVQQHLMFFASLVLVSGEFIVDLQYMDATFCICKSSMGTPLVCFIMELGVAVRETPYTPSCDVSFTKSVGCFCRNDVLATSLYVSFLLMWCEIPLDGSGLLQWGILHSQCFHCCPLRMSVTFMCWPYLQPRSTLWDFSRC